MAGNRPTGPPRATYRGLEIHPDPYFKYSAWTPGPQGTRFTTGSTIEQVKREIDMDAVLLSPDSPLGKILHKERDG
jgi:hypothetical protein